MAVADNQFALSPPNRHHGIDGFQSGLQGFTDGLAFDHRRSALFDGPRFFGGDGALAVEGLPQGIDYPADQFLPYRHFHDAAGAFHQIAFLNQ